MKLKPYIPTPIDAGWRAAWTPPDRGNAIEWLERNIRLPASYALEGPFRVRVNRPLIDPLLSVFNPSIREVYFRKPIQFGGSLILDVIQPWIFLNDPGPLMCVMQSDADMSQHLMTRLMPLFENCPPLRTLMRTLPKKAIQSDAIFFGGFFAVYTGANERSLQSKSIRWLLCDELWMKPWQSLWVHARGRVTAYERVRTSKIIGVSQAGNVGDVEDRMQQAGTRHVWHYRAANGAYVPLAFGGEHEDGSRWGLVWSEDARIGKDRWNISRACETARYVCRVTGMEYEDSERTRSEWNQHGAYLKTNDTAPDYIRSYEVNALMNRSFADLVREKLEADRALHSGNPEPMKDFVRKREARPWEERRESIELVSLKSGYAMGPGVWQDEAYRTMTLDRQQGRAGDAPHWWVNIRAWRRTGGSRLLFFGRVETVEAVRELQLLYGVRDRQVWQDAGWDAPSVYRDCVRFGWVAIFGSHARQTWDFPGPNGSQIKRPYSPVQRVAAPGGGHALYMHLGVNYLKDVLSNLLAGRGMLWELPDDLPETYRAQLTAEHRVEKTSGVWVWEKITDRSENHMWDTETYQVAQGIVAGAMSA